MGLRHSSQKKERKESRDAPGLNASRSVPREDGSLKRSGTEPSRGGFRYHTDRELTEDYLPTKQVLGTGLNGPVKVCVEQSDHAEVRKRKYAVKSVEKPTGNSSNGKRLLDFLRDELEVYLSLDHPHIAKLYDVYESGHRVHFVMELCTGGELYSRLAERSVYTEHDARKTTLDMLRAVTYLHEQSVVHRDIKLENFLYEDNSSDALLKLIDFGFAKHIQRSKALQVSCGSMTYVAPEVLDRRYTEQCDMWSLGVTSFILLFGFPPFQAGTDKELRGNIRAGRYVTRAMHTVSQEAQDFVKQTLVVDPEKRLRAQEAQHHAWLSDGAKKRPTVVPLDVLTDMRSFASASQLRRACLGVAVHCVSNEETKALRELFLRLDRDGNGTITFAELRDAMKATTHLELQELTKLFEGLDQYKDERINYSEFLAATLQGQLRAREAAIRATFDRMDTDHSGYITEDNIREILGTSVDAAALIAEADRAKDGRIDYGEFFRFLLENDEPEALQVTEKILENPELAVATKPVIERQRSLHAISSGNLEEEPEIDEDPTHYKL